jgi:ACS family hexuronate transporter-like MFS transporter
MAALLFIMMLLNYLDRVILSLVSPLLRKELRLTELDYAYAINAFLIAYAIMYVGSGLIVDRVGARRGLAISVTLWSIASLLHAGITSFKSLLGYRLFLGAAEPGGWTGAVKTTSEHFAPAQRGLVCGIFTSGAGFGALIAPPLVVWLTLHYGWRSVFAITGIAGLFWTPLWLVATRKQRPAATVAPTVSFQERLRWIARNPRCLSYVGTRFFGDTTGYFFLFWLPEYLIHSKSFTLGAVGALGWIPFCWNDAGALLGGYASGWLIGRWSTPVTSRKVVMTCAALFVVAGTLLQHATTVPAVLLSVSLCTFGTGVWASNLHSVATDAFPEHVIATVHGIAGSAGAVGGILFNTFVGYLASRGQYALVFAVLALLQPMGVALLWIWLPGPLRNRQGD